MEIIKQIVVSIIIITAGHYLYMYFKQSLTEPNIVTISNKNTVITPVEIQNDSSRVAAPASAATPASAAAPASAAVSNDIEASLKDYIRELNTPEKSQNISTTSIDSLPSNAQ